MILFTAARQSLGPQIGHPGAGRLCRRWVLGCLRYEGLVVGLVGLLVALAAAHLSRARPSGDIVRLLMEEGEETRVFRRMQAEFGGGELLIAAWPEASPYSDDALERLESVSASIAALPEVRSVASLASLPRLRRRQPRGLDVTPWSRALRRLSPAARASLVEELQAAPELVGLVGRRADAAAIFIVFERLDGLGFGRQLALLDRVEAIVREAGIAAPTAVHLSGFPAAAGYSLRLVQRSLTVFLPLSALCLLFLMVALFRTFWLPALALLIGALAVVVGMSASLLYSVEISAPQSAAPVIILVIALVDSVFLFNAFRRRLARGVGQLRAAAAAAVEVAPACVLTSLTTLLGFCSLMTVPAAAIRALGLAAAVGVTAALVLVFSLGVIVLRRLPAGAAPAGAGERVSPALARAVGGWAAEHPRAVLAVAALAVALALLGLSRLDIETDYARRFPPEHPLRVAQEFVASRLGGATHLQLVVRAEPRAALRPPVVARLARLEQELLAGGRIEAAWSVNTFLRQIHGVLHPHEAMAYGASEDRVRQALYFLPVVPAPVLEALVSEDRSAVRSTVRVEARGFLAVAEAARDLRALAGERFGDLATVEVTGLEVMLGEWLERLHRSQLRSLALVALVLLLVFAGLLRSLRGALLCLALNAAPIAVVFAALALADQPFDSDYLVVAMLGLCVVVDDTIHLLLAYRRRARRRAAHAAVHSALVEVGPSMVQTTVILVVGLAPLALSRYLSLSMFADELGRILLVGLAADLVALPALLALGLRGSRRRRTGAGRDSLAHGA